MVRKTYTLRPRLIHFPVHHVMTEAEAFADLRDQIQTFRNKNQLLHEHFAALKEESKTHDPSFLSVPTPSISDLPTSFLESKIDSLL